MTPLAATPSKMYTSMMSAYWHDHNKFGLPRNHSITTSTPEQYVYADRSTVPAISLFGAPVFTKSSTSGNHAVLDAGVRATSLVTQLAALGQLQPGTLPRPLKNNEIALQIDEFDARPNGIQTGIFAMNETSEPAASAIKAVLELQTMALQHPTRFP